MYKNAPKDGCRIGESRIGDLSVFKNIEEVAAAPVRPPAYEASRSAPEKTLKYKIEAEPDIERDVLNGAFQNIRKAKANAMERAATWLATATLGASSPETLRRAVSSSRRSRFDLLTRNILIAYVTPVSQDNEARQSAPEQPQEDKIETDLEAARREATKNATNKARIKHGEFALNNSYVKSEIYAEISLEVDEVMRSKRAVHHEVLEV